MPLRYTRYTGGVSSGPARGQVRQAAPGGGLPGQRWVTWRGSAWRRPMRLQKLAARSRPDPLRGARWRGPPSGRARVAARWFRGSGRWPKPGASEAPAVVLGCRSGGCQRPSCACHHPRGGSPWCHFRSALNHHLEPASATALTFQLASPTMADHRSTVPSPRHSTAIAEAARRGTVAGTFLPAVERLTDGGGHRHRSAKGADHVGRRGVPGPARSARGGSGCHPMP
jgi:hypothetical protein